MTQMQAWKSGIVKKLTGGVQGWSRARARVREGDGGVPRRAPGQADVRDGKPEDIVEAEHIVIATGSLPIEIPGFKFDHKRVLDSTSALDLAEIPKRMVCVGGGIIGLELGQTFQRLGTQLIVLEGLRRILERRRQRVRRCRRAADQEGWRADPHRRQGARLGGARRRGVVKAEIGGKVQEFATDVILVGVGRRPVTRGFGLEKTGVKVSQRGFIEVDNRLQTNVKGIYAVGDVAGSRCWRTRRRTRARWSPR
jgi:dihydrolipoamide dehydrogenase